MNNTLIGDNAVSSYIGFAITSGCEILLRSDIVIRNDKASAQLFTCAKVKAPGAQKPECTKVHEDFEHRVTMDLACVNSCAAVL